MLTAGGDDPEITVGTVDTQGDTEDDGATAGTGSSDTGSDDTTAGTTAGTGSEDTAESGQVAEAWPVTIGGTPLAPLQTGVDDPRGRHARTHHLRILLRRHPGGGRSVEGSGDAGVPGALVSPLQP